MKNTVFFILATIALGAFSGCQDINVDTETVDEPVFDLTQGPYNALQTVHLVHGDPLVTVHYAIGTGTTSAAAQADALSAAFAEYVPGTGIDCGDVVTVIRAYATKPGLASSAVNSARYAVVWQEHAIAGLAARSRPALVPDGTSLYLLGGYEKIGGFDESSKRVELVSTSDWSVTAGSAMLAARSEPAALLSGSDIYLFGGTDHLSGALASTECGDSSGWTAADDMPHARERFRASSVGGIMYIYGGTYAGALEADLKRLYSYEPAEAEPWTELASMISARYSFSSATYDGEIYAFGGLSGGSYLSAAERYDPVANTWHSLSAMPGAREGSCASESTGYLFVIGGRDNLVSASDSVFRYNPGTDAWSTMTPMPVTCTNLNSATVSGAILIFGQTGSQTDSPIVVYEYHPSEDF